MNTGPTAVSTPMARVAAAITPAVVMNSTPEAADSASAAAAAGWNRPWRWARPACRRRRPTGSAGRRRPAGRPPDRRPASRRWPAGARRPRRRSRPARWAARSKTRVWNGRPAGDQRQDRADLQRDAGRVGQPRAAVREQHPVADQRRHRWSAAPSAPTWKGERGGGQRRIAGLGEAAGVGSRRRPARRGSRPGRRGWRSSRSCHAPLRAPGHEGVEPGVRLVAQFVAQGFEPAHGCARCRPAPRSSPARPERSSRATTLWSPA